MAEIHRPKRLLLTLSWQFGLWWGDWNTDPWSGHFFIRWCEHFDQFVRASNLDWVGSATSWRTRGASRNLCWWLDNWARRFGRWSRRRRGGRNRDWGDCYWDRGNTCWTRRRIDRRKTTTRQRGYQWSGFQGRLDAIRQGSKEIEASTEKDCWCLV